MLRIRPTVRIRWDELDVISEHNKTHAACGYVAVAKFGSVLERTKLKRLRDAVRNADGTRLCIIVKRGGKFESFSSEIRDVYLADEVRSIKLKHPDYYGQISTKPSMWFVLKSALEPCSIEKLQLDSSKRPLRSVLKECRTSMMLVSGKL